MYVIENYTTNTYVSTLLQILSNMEKWHMIWVKLKEIHGKHCPKFYKIESKKTCQPYIPNKF